MIWPLARGKGGSIVVEWSAAARAAPLAPEGRIWIVTQRVHGGEPGEGEGGKWEVGARRVDLSRVDLKQVCVGVGVGVGVVVARWPGGRERGEGCGWVRCDASQCQVVDARVWRPTWTRAKWQVDR